MLTSYWYVVCGVPPVDGVFTFATPVGLNPRPVKTVGSTHVLLAPVSRRAITCVGTATDCLAVTIAARLAALGPIYAAKIGPCGDSCKLKKAKA